MKQFSKRIRVPKITGWRRSLSTIPPQSPAELQYVLSPACLNSFIFYFIVFSSIHVHVPLVKEHTQNTRRQDIRTHTSDAYMKTRVQWALSSR